MDKKGNKTKFRHNKWNKAEDAMLRLVMTNAKKPNWNEISKQFVNRNARQCQERWTNYLSPTVNNDPWTEREDELLKQKYNELGSKWSVIARFFTNRTNTNVKNRWIALNRIASKTKTNSNSVSQSNNKSPNQTKTDKETGKSEIDPTISLLSSLEIPNDEKNDSSSKKLLPSIHQTTEILKIKSDFNSFGKPPFFRFLISNQKNLPNRHISYDIPSNYQKLIW